MCREKRLQLDLIRLISARDWRNRFGESHQFVRFSNEECRGVEHDQIRDASVRQIELRRHANGFRRWRIRVASAQRKAKRHRDWIALQVYGPRVLLCLKGSFEGAAIELPRGMQGAVAGVKAQCPVNRIDHFLREDILTVLHNNSSSSWVISCLECIPPGREVCRS